MTEFKLHSKGENWFHFRKDLNSAMESFSITYCHDGTVCMTGDYGCLVWRREYFPKQLDDYGFPSKSTDIKYFAEKVIRAEDDQKIKTWKKEDAIKEIKELLAEYQKEEFNKGIVILNKVLDEIDWFESGEYGYIQMLESFNNVDTCLGIETFYNIGKDYTNAFKMKFSMLQSVADIILNEVNK